MFSSKSIRSISFRISLLRMTKLAEARPEAFVVSISAELCCSGEQAVARARARSKRDVEGFIEGDRLTINCSKCREGNIYFIFCQPCNP